MILFEMHKHLKYKTESKSKNMYVYRVLIDCSALWIHFIQPCPICKNIVKPIHWIPQMIFTLYFYNKRQNVNE